MCRRCSRPACRTSTCSPGPRSSPRPGPRATITDRLESELNKALDDPAVKDTFRRNGYELFPGSPASVTELIRKDLARWTELAKAAGLKAD